MADEQDLLDVNSKITPEEEAEQIKQKANEFFKGNLTLILSFSSIDVLIISWQV